MASENANREKTVKVEYLTRVEGEGGFTSGRRVGNCAK